MPHERAEADRPRVAVVTGGTDGIGKEIPVGLARCCHHLIVIGRDDAKARAQEDLVANGAAIARFIQADLAQDGQ
jgi:short-subunit dehydrogenase